MVHDRQFGIGFLRQFVAYAPHKQPHIAYGQFRQQALKIDKMTDPVHGSYALANLLGPGSHPLLPEGDGFVLQGSDVVNIEIQRLIGKINCLVPVFFLHIQARQARIGRRPPGHRHAGNIIAILGIVAIAEGRIDETIIIVSSPLMRIDAQRPPGVLQRLLVAHIAVHELGHEHESIKMVGICGQSGQQFLFCLRKKLLRHRRPRQQGVALGRSPVEVGRRGRRPLHDLGLLIEIVHQLMAAQRKLPVDSRHTAAHRVVEWLQRFQLQFLGIYTTTVARCNEQRVADGLCGRKMDFQPAVLMLEVQRAVLVGLHCTSCFEHGIPVLRPHIGRIGREAAVLEG